MESKNQVSPLLLLLLLCLTPSIYPNFENRLRKSKPQMRHSHPLQPNNICRYFSIHFPLLFHSNFVLSLLDSMLEFDYVCNLWVNEKQAEADWTECLTEGVV